jgi:sugar/nucleoside kinase (ribokinase family)
MTHGFDPFASARLGVIHASLKCRGRGAVASLPQSAETMEWMQEER